jgi:hypothetical protein
MYCKYGYKKEEGCTGGFSGSRYKRVVDEVAKSAEAPRLRREEEAVWMFMLEVGRATLQRRLVVKDLWPALITLPIGQSSDLYFLLSSFSSSLRTNEPADKWEDTVQLMH